MFASTHTFRAELLSEIETLVAKLNRRAVRIGVEPLTLTVDAESVVQGVATDDNPIGDMVSHRYLTVTISGVSPVVGGWTFAGTLEHLGASNIMRAIPGVALPESFRTIAANCEHCNKPRDRKDTYVVVSAAGEFKQVGKSCLRDFTGHKDPHAVAAWLEEVGCLFGQIEAGADDDAAFGGAGGRRISLYAVSEVLSITAAVIAEDGWMSKTKATEFCREATADKVSSQFNPPRNQKNWVRVVVTDEAKAKAAAVVAWVGSQDASWSEGSDYRHNLSVLCGETHVGDKHLGLLCSAVAAYDREMGLLAERKAANEATKDSEYVGKVGDRLELTLEIVSHRTFEGDYGCVNIYNFKDAEGNRYVWFGSTALHIQTGTGRFDDITITEGAWPVKATVKGHGVSKFNGQKETQLTRVQINAGKPEKASKEEAAAAKVVKEAQRLVCQATQTTESLCGLRYSSYTRPSVDWDRVQPIANKSRDRRNRRQDALEAVSAAHKELEAARIYLPAQRLLESAREVAAGVA